MPGEDDYGSADAFSTGNPAGFMAYHISIGSSAREARADYRDNYGGSTGDTAWNRMYGQIADTLARIPDQAALDPGQLPNASDYATWAMGGGGMYATQVEVMVTDLETGLVSMQPHTFVTDYAHTPNEATADAERVFGDADVLEHYEQSYGGAFVVHVWQTVPFGSLGG